MCRFTAEVIVRCVNLVRCNPIDWIIVIKILQENSSAVWHAGEKRRRGWGGGEAIEMHFEFPAPVALELSQNWIRLSTPGTRVSLYHSIPRSVVLYRTMPLVCFPFYLNATIFDRLFQPCFRLTRLEGETEARAYFVFIYLYYFSWQLHPTRRLRLLNIN